MDTKFLLDGHIVVIPTYENKAPHVTVKLNDQKIWTGDLLIETAFIFSEVLTVGTHKLSVTLDNKTNSDSNLHITVSRVTFEGITSPSFVYQGVYRPEYPEPWATEQQTLGVNLENELVGVTELGWNGTWELEFTVPVFTWIHRVEHLGWIYD